MWLWLAACGGAPTPATVDTGGLRLSLEGPVTVEVAQPTTYQVVTDQGVAVEARYRVDGQPVGAEALQLEHRFEAAGRHWVQATVGDAEPLSLEVAVDYPIPAVPPRSASSLAVLGTGLVAVVEDLGAVLRIDHGEATRYSVCDGPRSVAVAGERLVVACSGQDRVVAIDAETGAFAWATDLGYGSRPFGVVATSDAVFVTSQGAGTVTRLSLDGEVTATAAPGPDLRGLAVSGSRVFVSRHRSSEGVGQIWSGSLDLTDWQPVLLPLHPGPDSDTSARGVPTYLERLYLPPDGTELFAPGLRANIERGLYREGRAFTHDTTVRADLRRVSLSDGSSRALRFDDRDRVAAVVSDPRGWTLFALSAGAETVDIFDRASEVRVGGLLDVGHGATGLALQGETLWVLSELSRELRGYDVSNLSAPQAEPVIVDLLGGQPEPLDADVLAGKVLFHRSADRRMTAAGYVSCASCHLDGEGDGLTWDFTDRGEGLRNTPTLRRQAGLEGQPLHWTGNFDELQDFEGDIRGPQAGAGFMAAMHWAETEDALGAEKAGRSDELDQLAAYVASLEVVPGSPHRSGGQISAAAERGRLLFDTPEVGCSGCHAGGVGDSRWLEDGVPLLYDVGTLGPGSGARRGEPLEGLDTPDLGGLFGSAPYLHDGSAQTLREVLVDRNPTDQHGVTSQLSASELDDLEAYLLALE